MPAPTDYAIIEYRFIRFDKRFRALASDSHRLHYLAWWALSVFERPRTDWWVLRKDIDLITFGDSFGFPPETTAETVLAFLRDTIENGLARRARGGAYVLIGTRDKHEKLRNWRPKIGSAHADRCAAHVIHERDRRGTGPDQNPPTPHGGAGASPNKTSRREGYEALRRKVQTGAIRTASSNGILFAASVSAETKRIVLRAVDYSEADPIALGRDDPWDSYEWREAAQVKGGERNERSH